MRNQFEIYAKVRSLISEDKLNEAVKVLLIHFDDENILIQSSRLQSLKNHVVSGTISFEDSQIEKNKIRRAIITLAKELTEVKSIKRDKRILRKLELFASIFNKEKKRGFIVLFGLLMLLEGDKLRKALILISALILMIAGASY